MACVACFLIALVLWVLALANLWRYSRTTEKRLALMHRLMALQTQYLRLERSANQQAERYTDFLEMRLSVLEAKQPRHGRDGKFVKVTT